MARAQQAARRKTSPAQAVPPGLWVMLGVVIVLFIGILVWLGTRPEQPPTEAKTLPVQAPVSAKAAAPENKPDAKTAQKDVREVRSDEAAKAAKANTPPPVPPPPRYDFYQMLPEQSIGQPTPPAADAPVAKAAPTDLPPSKAPQAAESPKPSTSLPPAVEKPATAAANATETKVSLQVGSFRRYEEADRRKAELALLGYSASVQTANVNGETWHRVKIGPLPDAEARKARDRLKAVGMNPMLIKGS